MLTTKNLKKHIKKVVKKVKAKKINPLKVLGISFLVLISLIVLSFVSLWAPFIQRIHPGIFVIDSKISGKSVSDAANEIAGKYKEPEKVLLKIKGSEEEINLEEVGFSYNPDATANKIYFYTRTGNLFYDFLKRLTLLFKPKVFGISIDIDEVLLKEKLSLIFEEKLEAFIPPSVEVSSGKIIFNEGQNGEYVDITKTVSDIENSLSLRESGQIEIQIEERQSEITDEEKSLYVSRAEKLMKKQLDFAFEYQNFTLKGNDILKLLDYKGEYDQEEISSYVSYLSKEVNREPQNSVLSIVGGKVSEFVPSKDGIKLNEDSLKEIIKGNLRELENSETTYLKIDIPTEKTPPEISTGDINDLGINTLIGRGSSRFVGSIASRIFNIGVASSRINGALVAPGETFSFNATVGDISKETGYKEAYIIKDGQTVLGDGGGVCQVSTTLFRAALDAGLPILERRAHAYRVGYYEQDRPVGFDATVYNPTTDFKFKNDTPAHILIQTTYSPKTASLVFEIYGTEDGRQSQTTKPIVTDVTPPPEDLYIDDPTLPLGQVKQIDYKAWGAKARFTYTVTRGGETVYQKTFYSVYQPWQAKFLRGTMQ